MTVRYYSSLDASAPTLQGIVGGAYSSGWADGSLLNLLDKILVTGYGSKTAAGWARTYTGTSKGVFTQGAGSGFKLRVLDDGSATGGAREAILRGYESMSDVDTGTGANATGFPAAADRYTRKSGTADTTQRGWEAYADARTLILFMSPTGLYYEGLYFGDFYSFIPGDAYNCALLARNVTATGETAVGTSCSGMELENATVGNDPRWIAARGGSQIAGSGQQMGLSQNVNAAAGAIVNVGSVNLNFAHPNPFSNKIYMRRPLLYDATTAAQYYIRGYLRGLWVPMGINYAPFGSTFAGAGALAGKSFRVASLPIKLSATGKYTVETSDTWDTN